MARTRKSALYIANESTYGTDPSANGSGYTYVPVLGQMGMLKDGKQLLETNYHTRRNFPTAPEVGADGWSFDFEVPLIGLTTAAGDGAAPGADDWADTLHEHVFAESVDVSGEGVGSGSTTSSLVLDTDIYNVQQLVPVYEASVPTAAPRTQWMLLAADAGTGTYGTITPTQDQAPTTAAVAYGTKTYQPSDTGGASVAFVYCQDDVVYTLLGGRCTSAVIVAENGQIVRVKYSFSGDSKTEDTSGKSALPAIAAFTQPACKALLSPVWFNGTKYATRMIEVDLGIAAAVQEATAATNGRGDYESIELKPKVTIEPIFTNAIQNLKRTPTRGRLLIQFGGGVLSSGQLNTCAIHCEQAAVTEADPKDDQGRIRNAVVFQVTDAVEFSTGVAARFFQFVRA